MEWKKKEQALESKIDDSHLWHKRLDHSNYSTLKQIILGKIIENTLQIIENMDLCDVCQYGKQNMLPFPLQHCGEQKKIDNLYTQTLVEP